MTTIQQNVPALRFKDEQGKDYPDWKEKLLGDIARFSKGKGVSKSDISKSGAVMCIQYGQLYTHYGETISNVFSSTNLPVSELFLSKTNDVIIPASGETAMDIASASCVLVDGVALGGDINIIRCQQNGVFLAYYLNYKKLDIARLAQGISVIHLYATHLKLLKLKIPTQEEQQKIANFLSSVDSKIKQLNQKKALLEQYKKGVMQKLFSQEIRFKDEQGKDYPDWKEKLLGDIARFSKGKGVSKSDISKSGAVMCIQYGQLYTHYGETISNVFSSTNLPVSELFLSKTNDVIIPASGETAMDIASASCVLVDGVALGGDINIIRCQQNGVFLAYYLNYKKLDIARLAQGISVIHLYAAHLKLLKLKIPTREEQQKIAAFLSSLDTKTELVAEQFKQAQTFKKGLLQQMFI